MWMLGIFTNAKYKKIFLPMQEGRWALAGSCDGRDELCWFEKLDWTLSEFFSKLSERRKHQHLRFYKNIIYMKWDIHSIETDKNILFSRISSANLENLSLHRSVDNSNLKLSTSLMYRSIAIHLDKRDTSFVTWKIILYKIQLWVI